MRTNSLRRREFAYGQYRQALDKGDRMSRSEYHTAIRDIARYTGLSPKYMSKAIGASLSETDFLKYLL